VLHSIDKQTRINAILALHCKFTCWAARYNTWLLIKLTPKLFFSCRFAFFLAQDTFDHTGTLLKSLLYMVMYYSFAQPRAVIWQMYLCTVAIVYACTGTAYLMSQVGNASDLTSHWEPLCSSGVWLWLTTAGQPRLYSVWLRYTHTPCCMLLPLPGMMLCCCGMHACSLLTQQK